MGETVRTKNKGSSIFSATRLFYFSFSNSSNTSSGIIGLSPFGVIPGYRQVEITLIPFGLFNITYIIQTSVGCFFVPVTCILAKVPGAIPSSFLSGFLKMLNTLFSEKRYCRILDFECWVQIIFLSLSGSFNNIYFMS